MSDRLTRAYVAELEVRADGRTVVGIAVPFNSPAQIRSSAGSYTENFVRGAFARTIAERGPDRVKVLGLHNDTVMPLGRAHALREESDGLHAELRISNTRAGDEALELVRDGALDSMSIGFSPVAHRLGDDGTVHRTEVRLHEISLVPFPAYDGARIAGVRAEAGTTTYIDLSLARRRQALVELKMRSH